MNEINKILKIVENKYESGEDYYHYRKLFQQAIIKNFGEEKGLEVIEILKFNSPIICQLTID